MVLVKLWQIGVEVLENAGDYRFVYFNNKLNSLIMKRHIVSSLHEASEVEKKRSMESVAKAELQDKK